MLKNAPEDGSSGPGTVVGVNVALSGTLKDQNDIVIYGMVEGEVISERTVSVGQTAQVKGPVRGDVVTISGTVRGEVEATSKLEITDTGKIYGSITAKDLVINSGAILIGNVTMGEEEPEINLNPEDENGDSTNVPINTELNDSDEGDDDEDDNKGDEKDKDDDEDDDESDGKKKDKDTLLEPDEE